MKFGKKISNLIFFISLAILLIFFRAELLDLYHRLDKRFFNQFSEIEKVSVDSLINKIDEKIIAPPPLRSNQRAASSFLTKSGVIKYTNIERQNNGLPALQENSKLDAAAQAKLKNMFDQQYFEHISPAGKGPGDLAEQAGYQFVSVGENLATGNFKNDQELVTAWMNSPGHRANILGKHFSEIGVAVGKGNYQGQTVWMAVQEFGLPASACPQPDSQLKAKIDNLDKQINELVGQIEIKKEELDQSNPRRDPTYNEKVDAYNQLVNQHNNLVGELKKLVADYNVQVNNYNNCLK